MRNIAQLFALGMMLGGAIIVGACSENMDITMIVIGIVLLVLGFTFSIVLPAVPAKNVPQNRTKFKIVYDCDSESAEKFVQSFLKQKKFKQKVLNNENVFCKGNGFWTARKVLTYKIEDDGIFVDAWIATGIGKAVIQELALNENFYGALPKKQLKRIIEELGVYIKTASKNSPLDELPNKDTK
ncbi:MAG: hypothetical protein ACI4R8_00780 [Candidatus Caccovivens sp.]